jgi:hypothetical protein
MERAVDGPNIARRSCGATAGVSLDKRLCRKSIFSATREAANEDKATGYSAPILSCQGSFSALLSSDNACCGAVKSYISRRSKSKNISRKQRVETMLPLTIASLYLGLLAGTSRHDVQGLRGMCRGDRVLRQEVVTDRRFLLHY